MFALAARLRLASANRAAERSEGPARPFKMFALAARLRLASANRAAERSEGPARPSKKRVEE